MYKITFTHTITYIQYCLKIKTNGFQTFLLEIAFGGNGNHTFFVFGGNGKLPTDAPVFIFT
jgi:hypothetical protein